MKGSVLLWCLVIAVFLIMSASASAIDDSEVLIASDSDWIVAGGVSATISVSCTNSSYSITSVDFECTDIPLYGDVAVNRVTGSPFNTYFTSTKSGIADIQAQVSYVEKTSGDTGMITKIWHQKIDHAVPDKILNITYLNEVTVGEETPVIIFMTDSYGNLIDSKYEDETGATPEYIELKCSPEDSYFIDGADYIDDAKVYVDSTGAASITYRVSQSPGDNLVTIMPPEGIAEQYRTIEGLSNAVPFSIISGINPNNAETPYQPADEESKFYITYYLIDQFGNPAGNRTIHISSDNPNDIAFDRTSNLDDGSVSISYGPTSQKSVVTLTAYSVDNESVRVENTFMFESTEPVDMILTANPEVMPSHEVSSERTSAIRAKVIDERGNPVANEIVDFSIESKSYPSYCTYPPSLSAASAATDEDGQAIVYFTPGSFIYDTDNPLYEIQASANCTVQAEWENAEGEKTNRAIVIEWKNFPYLSVESEVNPETVSVNDTVDVTVRLIGDGWALQPDPIDVMLCADRSGSMLYDYPDRMVTVMNAMKEFTSAMSESRDRIGLTSFGTSGYDVNLFYDYNYWGDYGYYCAGEDGKTRVDGYFYHGHWVPGYYVSDPDDDAEYIKYNYTGNGFTDYATSATLDQGLTLDYSLVTDAINSIVPMMGTPMRGGVYLALKQMIENPNKDSNAVRAVIVLSDGDYTTGDSNGNGDPLARPGNAYYPYFGGSAEENLSVYAKNNNIKIYTIAFAEALSEDGRRTLQVLGESTGGKFYDNVDASNVNEVYKDIAGELKTDAGVNTLMDLDFKNIELNNVTVPNSYTDPILRYKNVNNVSTVITKWNKTGIVIPRYTVDDTDEWSANHSLSFDVGTIKLSETWETTFRLEVLKDGNINIFGPGSTITFNNGTDSLSLPKTYITALYNLTATGIDFKDLAVTDLHYTNTGEITDIINLEWNLNYTGEYHATENLYYMRSGDDVWNLFDNRTTYPDGPVEETETAQLVVKDLPPGEYSIRVHAKSADTADSIAELLHSISIGDSTISYIKIE